MLLEMICKKLGVEIGEEWKNDVGDTYKITDKGLYLKFAENDWEPSNRHDYVRLLTGKLKPVWKPKIGELFWAVQFENLYNVNQYLWSNAEWENQLWEKGLVFQTKGKATEVANKMLEVLKNE